MTLLYDANKVLELKRHINSLSLIIQKLTNVSMEIIDELVQDDILREELHKKLISRVISSDEVDDANI